MGVKHQFICGIYNMLNHNKDGSYSTQAVRKGTLLQAAHILASGGYKMPDIKSLKQKHIVYLNNQWKESGLSPATIKNRNAHLRWLCQKLGKDNMMPSNDALGITKRQYVTNEDKSQTLQEVPDYRLKVINGLQRHLGLRREEAIKIQPNQADKGGHIELKPSWCKGGRGREVPINTPEAKYWLEEAKKLIGTDEKASLIPAGKTYKQFMEKYAKAMQRAGIRGHGLRHAYAQDLYKELTGWEPPAKGGPLKKAMTPEQQKLDYEARMIISARLGHSRCSITNAYLGGAKEVKTM
jgi:integrase